MLRGLGRIGRFVGSGRGLGVGGEVRPPRQIPCSRVQAIP